MTTTPPPAGDLLTAAGKLRDSREALPKYQRQPWEYRAMSVYMNGTSYGSVVAAPHVGPSPVSACTGAVGEYLALVASPHVTEALERHLTEIGRLWESDLVSPVVGDVLRSAQALAAAINHTGRD